MQPTGYQLTPATGHSAETQPNARHKKIAVEHDDLSSTFPGYGSTITIPPSTETNQIPTDSDTADCLNAVATTLADRASTLHPQSPSLTVKKEYSATNTEHAQPQTTTRTTDMTMLGELKACCQQWRTDSHTFPAQMTFPALNQLFTDFKKALIKRSLIHHSQQDSQERMVDRFFLGCLIMTHNKIRQMHQLNPSENFGINPDTLGCNRIFDDYHVMKMNIILNHPEMENTLVNPGITYEMQSFFVPNDVFHTPEITTRFVESLFFTLCEFYQSTSPSPTSGGEYGPHPQGLNLAGLTRPKELSPVAQLFEILGYWCRSGDNFTIVRGLTRGNEIAPIRLVDALKNSVTETHPFYNVLIKSQLDSHELQQFEPTPSTQKKNLRHFADSLKNNLATAVYRTDKQTTGTDHRMHRKMKPRAAPPSSDSQKPSPNPTFSGSAPPVRELADANAQPTLAKQVNLLLKNKDLTKLKQLLEQDWSDTSRLKSRQKQKIADFLTEQDPQYFQQVQARFI